MKLYFTINLMILISHDKHAYLFTYHWSNLKTFDSLESDKSGYFGTEGVLINKHT